MKLRKLLGDRDPTEVWEFTPHVLVLTGGDIAIADVAIIDDDNYCLMTPFRLFESEEADGNITMAAIRFVPGSTDTFFLMHERSIVTMGEMTEEMFSFYKRNVDSILEKEMSAIEDESTTKPDGNVVNFKPRQLH